VSITAHQGNGGAELGGGGIAEVVARLDQDEWDAGDVVESDLCRRGKDPFSIPAWPSSATYTTGVCTTRRPRYSIPAARCSIM
jgi:hypothetical protein